MSAAWPMQGAFTHLRINFVAPGQSISSQQMPKEADPDAHFIRELSFKARQASHAAATGSSPRHIPSGAGSAAAGGSPTAAAPPGWPHGSYPANRERQGAKWGASFRLREPLSPSFEVG